MNEREKVVEGLEAMREFFGFGLPSQSPVFEAYQNILTDAITLLKEQEPVEPEVYYVGTDKYKFYCCPVCKTAWYYKGKYCLGCGRKVKWE